MILARLSLDGLIASFVQSWMWLLLIVAACAFWVWVVDEFSMESLILAQDERWRRA
jgi:hypothetical protein